MKRDISVILIMGFTLILSASPAYSDDGMDRIRAVESTFYLVEAIFGNARFVNLDLNSMMDIEDLRGPLNHKLISEVVGSLIKNGGLTRGRLWVHRSHYRTVERWSRLSRLIPLDRIAVYDEIDELIADLDTDNDVAILPRVDLERLARDLFKERGGLREAVVLAPLKVRLEYMDQILISLMLMRELKEAYQEAGDPLGLCAIPQFKTLKALLESLFAMRAGFEDRDILYMIPQAGLSFEMRIFAILQNSLLPIRREDIERIRAAQATVRSI